MTFLSNLTGWQWALALAVPPAIFALYFLRLRRKPIEIPSTFLWKKSIEDLHVNSLWQRLRRNILLLLQLLIAAGMLAALTRPAWNISTTGERSIILIDNSASMNATDVSPSRLEAAKQKARTIVDAMKPGDAVMVISFSNVPTVLASYSEDKAAVKNAIDRIEPTARSTDIRQALVVASGLANPQRTVSESGDAEVVPVDPLATAAIEAVVYVISDGRFPVPADFSPGNLTIRYLKVGDSNNNVGLLALAARPQERSPEKWEVFARVRNYKADPVRLVAELLRDDERIDVRNVDLDGRGETGIVFPLSSNEEGRICVRLQVDDALDVDDAAYTVLDPPEPLKVLKIGPENPILDAGLATESMRQWVKGDSWPASRVNDDLTESNYDIIIFDRCSPKQMPSANTWFIGAVPPGAQVKLVPAKGPSIVNWDNTHPVLRYLNLDNVTFFESSVLELPEGIPVLLESPKGGLLAMLPRETYADLILAAPLLDERGAWQTDWPLLPSFPLFLNNVMRVLGGLDGKLTNSFKPGETIVVRPAKPTPSATVESPAGAEAELRPNKQGAFEFLDTSQTGIYSFQAGEQTRRIAVNLFDEEESNIEPVADVIVGSQKSGDVSQEFTSRFEGWRWLTLFALVVLMIEWFVYNKRVAM